MQPIQMSLSMNVKFFSEFFDTFLKDTRDFEHFEEKR